MKTVPIELDKPRLLRFDVNALSDAEEVLGMGIGPALTAHAGFRVLRTLLWAGLKWQERGLTLARAGTLIQGYLEQGHTLDELTETIAGALEASGLLGPAGGDDEGNGTGAGATGDSPTG